MCRPVFHRSQAPQTMTTILLSVVEQLHVVISGGFLRVIGGGSVLLLGECRRLIGARPPGRSGARRRLLPPATTPAGLRRGEPVPHVLLVERRLAPTRPPLVG